MQNQSLEIKTKLQVLKPVQEVFEAIADPEKMAGYFLAKGSGRLESNKTVYWSFPEFEGEFPVRVQQVRKNEYLSFFWDSEDGREMLVEVTLTPVNEAKTLITVTEKSHTLTEAGLKWLKGNSEGWANFLACLKAYLEYGINLRKGAFDFMTSSEPVATQAQA